jgi:hypothetical protein
MNIDNLVHEVHYTLALHSIQTTYKNAIVNLTNAIDKTITDPNVETIDTVQILALQQAIGILQNEIEIAVLELDTLRPILASQNYFEVLASSE